jgi:hypothetical protein
LWRGQVVNQISHASVCGFAVKEKRFRQPKDNPSILGCLKKRGDAARMDFVDRFSVDIGSAHEKRRRNSFQRRLSLAA